METYYPSYLTSNLKPPLPLNNQTIKKVLYSKHHNKTRKKDKSVKLKSIKYFIDPQTQEIYDVEKDRSNVKKILQANVLKNKRINSKNVVLPKQCLSNCWFNVMFVTYFISDKGREFTRPFRLLMVDGLKNYSGIKPYNLKKINNALFLLNLAIESSLTGSSFAYKMNTNEIIEDVYNSVFDPVKHNITNYDEFGNSVSYYNAIIKLLYPDNTYPVFTLYSNITHNFVTNYLVQDHLPDIFVVVIDTRYSKDISGKKKNLSIFSKTQNITATYEIDSICLQDTNKKHIGCFFTLNKKGFFFDGNCKRKKLPFSWKNNTFLNSNKNIILEKSCSNPTNFNMRNAYQILYYYRTQ